MNSPAALGKDGTNNSRKVALLGLTSSPLKAVSNKTLL